MTPDQFQQFLEHNERSTAEAIEKYVNGGIRTVTKTLEDHITKHDAFMEDVKPILQAYQGGKVFGELLKWVAGLGAAYLVLKGFFK